MAFKKNTTIIVNNNTSIFHTSFESAAANIQSTAVELTANNFTGFKLGYSVGVGSGRIVGGARGNYDSACIFLSNNFLSATKPSEAVGASSYGNTIAINCGRVVVGAPVADLTGNDLGAVYLYDLNGNYVNAATEFTSGDLHYFGSSVAVGSGRIVIGAANSEAADPGGGTFSGIAYIYSLNGTILRDLIPSGLQHLEHAGYSVSISDGIVAVGSPDYYSSAASQGRVSLFTVRGDSILELIAYDAASGDRFGTSVAVGCGRIVVGAPGDDDNGADSGSVYVYQYNGTLVGKIKPSDGAAGDQFGYSVSVGSGLIFIGAPFDDISATSNAGSSYIFNLDGTQIAKLTHPTPASEDYFGYSVSIKEGRAIAGVPNRDRAGNTDNGSIISFKLPETHDIYFEKVLDTFRY